MKKSIRIAAAAALVLALCPVFSAARAGDQPLRAGSNYNWLVLTPGHSQNVMFELGNIIFRNSDAFHAMFLFTLGEGRLTVRVGPSSSVGDFSGLVYAVAGLLGTQPVVEYGYNAETVSISADVPAASFGLLFTGIIAGIGSPDFPVVMGMVVSLL